MTGWSHINPTLAIPITIGSYPISDQPPNYTDSVDADLSARLNAIAFPASANISNSATANTNTNSHSTSNGNPNTASSNEQVVRPQPTAPPLPYPQNGLLTTKYENLNQMTKLIAHSVLQFNSRSSHVRVDYPSRTKICPKLSGLQKRYNIFKSNKYTSPQATLNP